MSATAFFLFNFNTPFHVGWRRPQNYIDGSTIARALMYLAYMLKRTELIDGVIQRRIKFSGLFPATYTEDNKIKLLLHPLSIPLVGKLENVEAFTLQAIREFLNALSCEEDDVAFKVINGKIYVHGKGTKVNVKRSEHGNVICRLKEDIVAPEKLFIKHVEHRNRIDRISHASDLFSVSGYVVNIPMWMLCEADQKLLDETSFLLNLLGEFGLGGYRGRGWGRFTVRRLEKDDIDGSDIEFIREMRSGKWRIPLGYIPLRSIISCKHGRVYYDIDVIEGYSGTVFSYVLPKVIVCKPTCAIECHLIQGDIIPIDDKPGYDRIVIPLNPPVLGECNV